MTLRPGVSGRDAVPTAKEVRNAGEGRKPVTQLMVKQMVL